MVTEPVILRRVAFSSKTIFKSFVSKGKINIDKPDYLQLVDLCTRSYLSIVSREEDKIQKEKNPSCHQSLPDLMMPFKKKEKQKTNKQIKKSPIVPKCICVISYDSLSTKVHPILTPKPGNPSLSPVHRSFDMM